MKFTRILKMLLVLALSTSITSCDEFFAIFDDPVESTDPVTPPEPDPEPNPEPTYASDLERPLTFKAAQDNVKVTFKFSSDAKPDYKKVKYTLDKGATWTALSDPNQAIILEKAGDIVMFQGDNPTYNGDAKFVVTKATVGTRGLTRAPDLKLAEIYGNIMSLLKGSDFSNLKELTAANEGAFRKLFEGCSIDFVSNDGKALVLPAEKLSEGCYASMFAGCTEMTKAPELPAETLADGCYSEMFKGCTSLTQSPTLPAPTLVKYCYSNLFESCSKLTSVTILATEVENGTQPEECVANWLKDAGAEVEGGLIVTVSDNTTISTADLTGGNDKVTIVNQSGDILPTGIWIKMGDKVLDKGDEIVMEVNQEIELTAVLKPAGTEGDVEWHAEAFYLMVINGNVTALHAGSTSIQVVCVVGNSTLTTNINFTIKEATMTVTATNYSGTYDTEAHGITVNAPEGATVKYGTTSGTYNLTENPTYTDAGTYTVYYEVTQANYTTVTGSATVTISKAAGTISFAEDSESKLNTDAAFTNTLTNTGDGTVTYSSDKTSVAEVNTSTGEVTIKGTGTATITATVTDGTNYTYATNTAQYTLTVSGQPSIIDREGYGQGDNPF